MMGQGIPRSGSMGGLARVIAETSLDGAGYSTGLFN